VLVIPRKWFNDPDKRWLAFWLLLAISLAEVGYRVYEVRKAAGPKAPTVDTATYEALGDQPDDHGRIAQWATQFMRIEDAIEILNHHGYACGPRQGDEMRCTAKGILSTPVVDIRTENQFLRSVRGFNLSSFGWQGAGAYFELRAPGLRFASGEAFARDVAERLRLKLADGTREERPVRVGGYRYSTEYLVKRLGMKCADEFAAEASVPEVRCATASLDGQRQKVVLRLSEDALPIEVEAEVDGTRATIALSARPDQGDDGNVEVAVRNPGKPLRMLLLSTRTGWHGFGDKMEATYAALDDASKLRVQRAVARQLDTIYTGEDEALRPALQQIDYGALFLRRFGTMRGGSVTARSASEKTYAAFAFAECDGRASFDARTCFMQYANERPEVESMVANAIAAVKSANPGLDSQHPVSQRLQRLEPLLKASTLR
jgi:hypothetical protein